LDDEYAADVCLRLVDQKIDLAWSLARTLVTVLPAHDRRIARLLSFALRNAPASALEDLTALAQRQEPFQGASKSDSAAPFLELRKHVHHAAQQDGDVSTDMSAIGARVASLFVSEKPLALVDVPEDVYKLSLLLASTEPSMIIKYVL
jgi:hypothetical protein